MLQDGYLCLYLVDTETGRIIIQTQSLGLPLNCVNSKSRRVWPCAITYFFWVSGFSFLEMATVNQKKWWLLTKIGYPPWSPTLFNVIASQRLQTLCKSQIHAPKMESRLYDRNVCNLKFPGYSNTEWKGIGTHKKIATLSSQPSQASQTLHFCSLFLLLLGCGVLLGTIEGSL